MANNNGINAMSMVSADAIKKLKPFLPAFMLKKEKQVGIDQKFDGKLSSDRTTVTDNSPVFITRLLDDESRIEYDRFNIAIISRTAYAADSRIKVGVNGISYESTASDNDGHPYQITTTGDVKLSKSQKKDFDFIKEKNKELELEAKAPMIAREMFLDGDHFREIVVNFNTDEIVDLPAIPGPKDGYLMKALLNKDTKRLEGWGLYRMQGMTRLEKVFAPWQVAQFSFDKSEWYGTPVLNSASIDQKRLAQQEASMHKAREERSFVKMNHIYPNTTYEILKKYAKEWSDRLKNIGRGVQTDYFSQEPMQMFDPANEQLQNINDVEYFERKLFDAIQRPQGLYGGRGQAINRATLDKQYESYVLFLSNITSSIGSQYKRILELQLILRLRSPKEIPFELKWTMKETTDWLSFVRGLGICVDKGMSVDTFLEEVGFNPDREKKRRELEDNIVKRGDTSVNKANQDTVDKNTKQRNSSNGQPNDKLKENLPEILNKFKNRIFSTRG